MERRLGQSFLTLETKIGFFLVLLGKPRIFTSRVLLQHIERGAAATTGTGSSTQTRRQEGPTPGTSSVIILSLKSLNSDRKEFNNPKAGAEYLSSVNTLDVDLSSFPDLQNLMNLKVPDFAKGTVQVSHTTYL